LTFQLFWTLYFYNPYISIYNALPFYPFLLWSLVLLPSFRIAKFRWGSFLAALVHSYSSSHAMVTYFLGKSVGWVSTNAKHIGVSAPFKQATTAVAIYLFFYISLIAYAVRTGRLHIFDYNYYSVQFWIFWNLTFSVLLLYTFYRTMERAYERGLDSSS